MITYPISSNLCKKIYLQCNWLYNFPSFRTGGVLLEKVFLEILPNSQENTCGKVSFSIKLQAEATASDLSFVSLEYFLFISFQQKN